MQTWNDKNYIKYGSFFTADAEYTAVTGITVYGCAAIEEEHIYPFSFFLKNATLTIDKIVIRYVANNLIFATVNWNIVNAIDQNQNTIPKRNGLLHLHIDAATSLISNAYNSDILNHY